MILVACVYLFVLIALLSVISRRGVEGALPLAVCFIIVFPLEAQLPLGFFTLTVQRLVTLVLLAAALMGKSKPDGIKVLPLKSGIIFVGLLWAISTVNSIDFVPSAKSFLSLLLDYFAAYAIFTRRITSEKDLRENFRRSRRWADHFVFVRSH